MLNEYFSISAPVGTTVEQKQRLLAVQAALEIAKASAESAAGDSSAGKMAQDLIFAAENISKLADAIQAALEK